MHARLAGVPRLKSTAERHGRRLIDVRTPPRHIPIASGSKRSGKRLLTVGTDCAIGKKYSALALARAFGQRDVAVDFRATGQTGIMIAGSGVPMDSVVADFEAGAAELLSPDAPAHHWDVIEGQGSLFHPAYAGVSLGLLHGSQPDVIVVCHDMGRKHILGYPSYPMPGIAETIELNLTLGRRTNAAIRCAGVSLNTSSLTAEDAAHLLSRESERLKCATSLDVTTPKRSGSLRSPLGQVQFNRLVPKRRVARIPSMCLRHRGGRRSRPADRRDMGRKHMLGYPSCDARHRRDD